MFYWNSLAFSIIQGMVSLSFLKPAWTSGSSQFRYCWSLAWRILSISLLACAAAAKSFQLCQTLCEPRDGSPPGSPVPGILQARSLEWVAISSSNAWKWKVKVKLLSCVRLIATPWTATHQAPPSMGFSRQEYWSGVPLPSPEFLQRRAISKELKDLSMRSPWGGPRFGFSRQCLIFSHILLTTCFL